MLAGIVLVLSLAQLSFGKSIWPRIFILGAPLIMILTGGKAGIVGGLLSGLLFYILQRKPGSAAGLLIGMAVLSILLLSVSTPLQNYAGAYIENEQVDNLSGRTDLWSAAVPLILESPFIGHGYMASKFISRRVEDVRWEAGHLHNAFLDVLYNNGLVGLLLILYMNLRIVRNLVSVVKTSNAQDPSYQISAAFLAIYANLLVNSLFNAIIGGRPSALFMIFLALVVMSQPLRESVSRSGTLQLETGNEQRPSRHALVPV